MEFRILGPLEIVHDGKPLALSGAKQRAIAGLLALQARRPVSADRLIDELWGEHPPQSAPHAIQVYVSGIRSALRAGTGSDEVVRTSSFGYALDVADEDIDARRFERLVSDAQDAAVRDPGNARSLLEQALALWRGRVLADIENVTEARLEAERLDELRLAATESLLALRLDCGEHVELVGTLKNLVTEHPLREQLCRHLMLALYRSGRQSEALAAYQSVRAALDELGLVPSRETRELEQAILRHEESLSLSRDRDSQAVVPLPVRLRPYGASAFVGREGEHRVLTDALTTASRGQRAAVLISGEPGIGKTRLVSEVADSSHRAGALVLGGRCDEGLEIPYQPLAEALEHLVDNASRDLLRRHVDEHGLAVARLAPSLGRRLGASMTSRSVPTEAERYVLFATIDCLLAAASAETGPLMLVLEDLHWADEPTVVLLRYILTSPRKASLAVIATLRPTDLDEAHPLIALLADMHREPHVSRVDLSGLSVENVRAFASALAGHELDSGERALADKLHMSTDGNPFFITEIVRALAEAGKIARGSGGWRVANSLDASTVMPTSISETLDRRVARLGDEVRECLTTASVVGDQFDVGLVATASGLDRGQVDAALKRATTAGLVVCDKEPRLRFAHALIDHWLYGQLDSTLRSRLHRRIAAELERRATTEEVSVTVLARHWYLGAGPGEIDKPLEYAILAGDDALKRLAPSEACRWYERALDLREHRAEPATGELCELLIRRGEAERQSGSPKFRDTFLEAASLARQIGDDEKLVRAALANTRGLQNSSGIVDEDRIEVLDAAINAVGPRARSERARLLATQAVELAFSGQWERRVSLSDEALALARELDDPATLANVLSLRFLTIWAPETHAERLANSGEAITVCERVGNPVGLFHAYHWRFAASIEAADPSEARRCMAQERELANMLRQPTLLWLAACHEADLAMVAGDLDEADRLALEAFHIGQASEPDAAACYAAQLSAIRHEQSRLGELSELLAQVVEANPGIPGFRAILARALSQLGRWDEARQAIAPSAAVAFADLPYDVTWLTVTCIYADCAAKLADRDAALLLLKLLEPWSELISYPGFGVGASVSHWLAELALSLGELDRADRHHADAVRLHERLGGPIWITASADQASRLRRAHSPGTQVSA